ncbi:MAG: O-antigen ligase family protein [candidate division Zixibacteria bacterium]|nr:O-antigen ligase family protein [candidate division Zixibacteria bacterium]
MKNRIWLLVSLMIISITAILFIHYLPYVTLILSGLLFFLFMIAEKEENAFIVLFFILIFFNHFRNVSTEATPIYDYRLFGFNIIEIIIIIFLAFYFSKFTLRGEIKISMSRFLLNKPILYFGFVLILASVIGLLFFGAKLQVTFAQLRPLSYVVILYFLTIGFIRTKSQLNKILWSIIVFTGLRAIHGMFLYFYDPSRQHTGGGSFTFVSHEAIFFMLILSLGFIFISSYSKKDWKFYTLLFVAIPTIFSFLFSFRRGAWLGMGLSFLITFMILPKTAKLKLVRVGIPFLFLVLIMIVVLKGSVAFEHLVQRFVSMTTTSKSISMSGYGVTVSNMYRIWETINGVISLKSYPIFGIGLGTEWPIYIPFRGISLPRFHFHNTWLSLWLKMGLLGVLSFVWINWLIFKNGLKIGRTIKDQYYKSMCLGLLIFILGFDISSIFVDWIYYYRSACLIGFVFGVMALLDKLIERGEVT